MENGKYEKGNFKKAIWKRTNLQIKILTTNKTKLERTNLKKDNSEESKKGKFWKGII